MTGSPSKWLALLSIPVLAVLLLLVGVPKLSDLNPVTAYRRAKQVWDARSHREPIQISQIAVDPRNPNVVYASSHFYGMLKSVDRGRTWRFVARGLGTSDVYSMAVHPAKPDTVYAATTGAGVYRSEDGAATWVQVNHGLTDTHVEDLAFDPGDPDTLYAATMREVFKSTDAGRSWAPVFRENRFVAERHYMHTLTVARHGEDSAPILFVGTPDGGFRRAEGEAVWERLDSKVGGQKLGAFAYDPRVGTLYGGALTGKLFASRDGGRTWELRGSLPGATNWINRIVPHPSDPATLFVGSKVHGVYRSTDGGRSWTELNNGLTHKVIKALAVDPIDPRHLYVGAPGLLAVSEDGAAVWRPASLVLPPYDDVVAWLGYTELSSSATPKPPAFWKEKCNECHGWTDPRLNFYLRAYWRVAPSRRDWAETVERMGALAKMTAEQKAEVLAYLNAHFGPGS